MTYRFVTSLMAVTAALYLSATALYAQSSDAFHDAYGTIIGPGTTPKIHDKNYYISQQSNMGGRGDVNAGVNPRGNVDVNPPSFFGDNPFGNSTVPNP